MLETMEKPISSLRTRPTLLFRLRDWRDEATWTEFYRLYYNFVYGCARRAGLPHADAEEVVQDVFKRVAETVHEFESDPARGSFRGWLLNLTRWRVSDKYRARKPHERWPAHARAPDDSEGTSTIERLPDQPDSPAAWEAEWQHHILEAALGRIARRVPAKQFQVFDLYRRHDWSVMRVARDLGVSSAYVYLTSHRLTKMLKKEVDALREHLS